MLSYALDEFRTFLMPLGGEPETMTILPSSLSRALNVVAALPNSLSCALPRPATPRPNETARQGTELSCNISSLAELGTKRSCNQFAVQWCHSGQNIYVLSYALDEIRTLLMPRSWESETMTIIPSSPSWALNVVARLLNSSCCSLKIVATLPTSLS